MKPVFTILAILLPVIVLAQSAPDQPPFKRFPTLPPLQLLLGDSTTKYTKKDIPKKKPVLLMLFSPECSHCQHTAEEILQRKNDLKGISIIMATLHPIWQMNEFAEKYRLKELENVVVGKDLYYILPPFYGIKNLPYLAFYDKKGNLIKGFEGSMPLQKILDTFRESK